MATTASQTMARPHTANSVYFPALDGIRALALLGVFVDHFCDVPMFGLGVNVFFVLSGFLITGILVDTRDQPHRLRNFYVRRTLRIFPLYYAIFVVLLLTTPLFHWVWNSAWWLWPAYLGNNLMYMPQWLPRAQWLVVSNGQLVGSHTVLQMGHFWTLCIEEQFYLIWPWFVFTRSRRFLLWFCGVVIAVLPVLRVLAAHEFPPAAIRAGVLFRELPFQADSLLLGAAVAILLRGQYRVELIAAGRMVANVLSVAVLAYIFCCVDLHIPWLHQPYLQKLTLTWHLSLVNLLAAGLILTALQPGSWLYELFKLRPLRWLGRISYGAYVFHNIPHDFYAEAARAISPAHFLLLFNLFGMVGMLVMSTLSYRYFETPFLRLKDRWTVRG